jgi:hypothetical protein
MMNTQMQDCIDDCHNAQETVVECINYCLENEESDQECVKLLMSVAEITATAAKFMMFDSEQHPQVCRVCAEICSTCAEYFDDETDEMYTRVAVHTRACADSCREMSGMRVRSARTFDSGFDRPWV